MGAVPIEVFHGRSLPSLLIRRGQAVRGFLAPIGRGGRLLGRPLHMLGIEHSLRQGFRGTPIETVIGSVVPHQPFATTYWK